jgi:hypothetical protein
MQLAWLRSFAVRFARSAFKLSRKSFKHQDRQDWEIGLCSSLIIVLEAQAGWIADTNTSIGKQTRLLRAIAL